MKKIIYILSATVLLLASSCEKWLDVKPDDEVYIEDALVDRQGFAQALSGIYTGLAKPTLYGRNLEYGMLDAMAGYWKVPTTNDFYELFKFEYTKPNAQDTLTNIWSGLYKNIRQCNFILDHIRNIEKDPYHNLIKGEALGLRAFLHLEAFKLFGPVVKTNGLAVESLPYYTKAAKVPQKFLSSGDFLNQVESDLQEAKLLLSNDPIIAEGREANTNTGSALTYNSLLDRRGVRMNYYAVLALLARKSQWEGKSAEAASRAKDLLSQLEVSKAIRLMENNELENNYDNKDIHFSKENILGLYVNDIVALTKVHFGTEGPTNATALTPEYKPFLQNIYEKGTGSTLDFRLGLWTINGTNFGKFAISSTVLNNKDAEKDHLFEVQLINLPEMYFMIAEDYLDQDLKESLNYLNTVRLARKLPNLPYTSTLTKEQVQQYLIDEVRREYIGEGHLFTFMKRLFLPLYRASGTIAASETMYKLPIPEDEKLYNTAN